MTNPLQHALAKIIGDAIFGSVDPEDTPNSWSRSMSAAQDVLAAIVVNAAKAQTPAPAPHVVGNEALLTALENIELPVVGHLFVARGGATARITSHELANGPDESSYLVRLSDVTKALEPIRASLAATEGSNNG